MEERPVEQVQAQAGSYMERGLPWHSHLLTPACGLNDRSQFALILEGESPLVAYVEAAPTGVAKELTSWLHGSRVRDAVQGATLDQTVEHPVIDIARRFVEEDRRWHHHVLFPGCIFNEQPAAWTLLIESGDERLEYEFEDEPMSVLPAIEQLFYGQQSVS